MRLTPILAVWVLLTTGVVYAEDNATAPGDPAATLESAPPPAADPYQAAQQGAAADPYAAQAGAAPAADPNAPPPADPYQAAQPPADPYATQAGAAPAADPNAPPPADPYAAPPADPYAAQAGTAPPAAPAPPPPVPQTIVPPTAAPGTVIGGAARAPQPSNIDEVSLQLLNETGQPTFVYLVPQEGKSAADLLFKVNIGARQRGYKSAVLEVVDPARGRNFRTELPNPLPEVIHWDGLFNETEGIAPDERYFSRILLIRANNEVRVSPVLLFTTRARTAYDDAPREKTKPVSLYVLPSGALSFVSLTSANFRSSLFPNLYGDISLIWQDKHSLILGFESTSNILFNTATSPTQFFYSEFSVGYRYRLYGSPLRTPVLPVAPPYAQYRMPPPGEEAYGAKFNLEVGARFYTSTLRGSGNVTLDGELARSYQGLNLVIRSDYAIFDSFRARGGLEFGKTFFRGELTYIGFEGGITYERFKMVSPGLQIRWVSLSGAAADDAFDNTPAGNVAAVSNQLFFLGTVLYFKL